jgi:allantoinase
MEIRAIALVIKLCREYRVPCHIVHLSSAEALPLIAEAKAEGLPLTVETCFHYLYFAAEGIPSSNIQRRGWIVIVSSLSVEATQFKCCPPIRSQANQEMLWEALKTGLIDYVVSDHSPCTSDLKVWLHTLVYANALPGRIWIWAILQLPGAASHRLA